MMRSFSICAAALFALAVSPAQAADKTTAVWRDGHTSTLSDEELVGQALESPTTPYPKEAREAKTTGSGLYELRINQAGAVTEVVIVKSSRSAVLDNAAKTTFRKWRFKPGRIASVRIPVAWSVNPVRD
jgi:TonB family protein